MNGVLRTAVLVPLPGLIPLGIALLSPFIRLAPVSAVAPLRRTPTGVGR
jgi:hypothetical protein